VMDGKSGTHYLKVQCSTLLWDNEISAALSIPDGTRLQSEC